MLHEQRKSNYHVHGRRNRSGGCNGAKSSKAKLLKAESDLSTVEDGHRRVMKEERELERTRDSISETSSDPCVVRHWVEAGLTGFGSVRGTGVDGSGRRRTRAGGGRVRAQRLTRSILLLCSHAQSTDDEIRFMILQREEGTRDRRQQRKYRTATDRRTAQRRSRSSGVS